MNRLRELHYSILEEIMGYDVKSYSGTIYLTKQLSFPTTAREKKNTQIPCAHIFQMRFSRILILPTILNNNTDIT
jgi:hypothetical protein